MLRFVEIFLFLAPFALFALWWVLGARAARWLPWTALAVVAVLAGLVLAWRDITSEPPSSVYVPAQMQDGTIVPGHSR